MEKSGELQKHLALQALGWHSKLWWEITPTILAQKWAQESKALFMVFPMKYTDGKTVAGLANLGIDSSATRENGIKMHLKGCYLSSKKMDSLWAMPLLYYAPGSSNCHHRPAFLRVTNCISDPEEIVHCFWYVLDNGNALLWNKHFRQCLFWSCIEPQSYKT